MKEYERVRAVITRLLEDSPLVSQEVIDDVHHLMNVGEEALAFHTMCSWIYEDELPITSVYYQRLVIAAQEIGESSSVDRLDELIVD
ncbi:MULTISPECIES: MafI family immunity protein [Streptomyces phaeochromogenes group]|uniref:MafI family immunity protein n=1 Tax=Streptomyces phaeochromogenes group TaxID=2838332 RepID=UPI0033EA328B|nr:MafI family immunity protein [Streptomyces phaeochromogenes]